MSQNFKTILGTDKLKDSYGNINGSLEALRSNFEGAAVPETAVKGQHAFINGAWMTYNGTAWVADETLHNHDDRYYTETEVDTKLAEKANATHNHDDRYYTETEVDTKLAEKANTTHNHDELYYSQSEVDAIAADIQGDVTTIQNQIAGGLIPSGIISLWSGASTAIPSGWALCDGTNGTPDLRDKFVMGAGGTYAVGATGGAAAHSHTASTGAHTLTAAQMPYHNHNVTCYYENATYIVAMGQYLYQNKAAVGSTYAGGNNAHNHTATVDSTTALPPYYALCYIMKV